MKVILAFLLGFLFASYAGGSETVDGAKKDFQAFKKEMETRMDSFEKQLEDLKSKAKENGQSAEEKTEKSLKKLKSQFANSLDSLNSKIQKALKDE